MNHYFIDHPKELKVYQSMINSLCHVDQTLPEQVFKQRKNIIYSRNSIGYYLMKAGKCYEV